MKDQTLLAFLNVPGDTFELTNPDFTPHDFIAPEIVNRLISYDEYSLLPLFVLVPCVVKLPDFECSYFYFALTELFLNVRVVREFQKF
jgi:hypothetical protein